MGNGRSSSPGGKMTFHKYLTIEQAKLFSREAAANGMAIATIEGFIRRDHGYEARIDCIWNSKPARQQEEIAENNLAAAHMVEFENEGCDHFTLSVWSIESELNYWVKNQSPKSRL